MTDKERIDRLEKMVSDHRKAIEINQQSTLNLAEAVQVIGEYLKQKKEDE